MKKQIHGWIARDEDGHLHFFIAKPCRVENRKSGTQSLPSIWANSPNEDGYELPGSNKNKLLLGLACDRIVYLGMTYIKRGWITKDEYETLHDYLWIPYQANGGNGTAARVMSEVDKLEIR